MLLRAGSLVLVAPWLIAGSIAGSALTLAAGTGELSSLTACNGTARVASALTSELSWSDRLDSNVFRRGHTDDDDDDDNAAIPDDAPAAQLDDDEGAAPPLAPIGTLASSPDSLPNRCTSSRRSPRGPPVFH